VIYSSWPILLTRAQHKEDKEPLLYISISSCILCEMRMQKQNNKQFSINGIQENDVILQQVHEKGKSCGQTNLTTLIVKGWRMNQ